VADHNAPGNTGARGINVGDVGGADVVGTRGAGGASTGWEQCYAFMR
jgi:hypothetical protein